MDPVSEKKLDQNQLPHQRELLHQQQQLLKQQLQQRLQSNRQQIQQQLTQQVQSQTEQQQQHRLLQTQSQSQQQLSQITSQFRQQQQQKQQLQTSTKQHQPLRNNQSILQQQILQQEHLKQQKQLLDSQKKQEQALLELLQLQDTNDVEDGAQEERLIAQQQRPQLIQQQKQLHLQQQQRQKEEHLQELHILQQKQLQQSQNLLQQPSQLAEQSQLVQQTQQQQSLEIQPQFSQQSHLVKQPQIVHKSQLLQQSQIVNQPQIVQHSQTLNQSQVIQQPQLIQQPQIIQQTQLVQQSKIIQSQQLVTMSTQQQTKKPSPHSQQLLQQQLQQLLSKNKNYPQRIVVLGSQPQQQQLVTQQSQRVLNTNTSVQQQLLPQQMQCVVVTGSGQPQSQQMQRVVVAATGQQKQQPQQMQRVVVTSTSGQKQQQLTQQQLQQIQHVVIPSTNQQQSLQLQNVINPCPVQQQPQQMQRVVVAATGQTQPQLQQTQRVIVTSTSGQQQQQLVQNLQPVAQRIVIGQLKTSSQTQQIQSPSQRNVVLGHVQQQVIQRPSPAKQQQQRVVIAGQQQILKLPSQQQSMQQLLKLPQSQQTTQQLLKLPQEMLLQQQQLSQQLSLSKSQQNDTQQQYDGVQLQQHKPMTQQQVNLKSSDQSLVQQLHVKQSHQQLQQLHIQSSQKQTQKPLKQNQQEQQIEQPHRSSGVIIGQRQQATRPESDDLQQKHLQQLQRKNLQERLLVQQRQQKEKQQKLLQEQQLQQKQQLREQVLLLQHLKQQHQLLFKQSSSPESRVSFMTGINQDQKQHDKQETNSHHQRLHVQKPSRYITKTADAGQFILGEFISLSSSSDEDDDDNMVRDQRNLFRKTKRLICEQFHAISMVLEPKYQVYYVDLLKNWINGQLSREEFDRKFHNMIYVSTTSIENGDAVISNDSHHNFTMNSTTASHSKNVLVTSNYQEITDKETVISTLDMMTGTSTSKPEEETMSTLKRVEEKHKETDIDVAITKRVQLHNALVESLTAYMPFQILRQKRRDARVRGFTETGFPLRLFTYMDVPQVRESIMHWYPHIPGSLARWYSPARIPCITSLLENNIENKPFKPFRKSLQKEAVDAIASAILLRPPSYESLSSLLEVATNSKIVQAAQLQHLQTEQPFQHLEMNSLKRSRRKQFDQMAQKIHLRDWLTNWLRQLKVQGQELEYDEHLLTQKLRRLQAQILNRRNKVLAKLKIREKELQARVRRYCDRSSLDDEINEDFPDSLEDNENQILIINSKKGRILKKNRKINQHQQIKKTDFLPRKIIRRQERKSLFSMATLLKDRYKFQLNQQMLQEIREECLQIKKVYDHVREIRKKYCPCCEFDIRPCQYRKLMRKFLPKLRVNEPNIIEDEIESNLENETATNDKEEVGGIKGTDTLLIVKENEKVENKISNSTQVTEPLDKICEDIQQNTISTMLHTMDVSSNCENPCSNESTSTTFNNSISHKTSDSITENATDSSVTTLKSTEMTTVSQTMDVIKPAVEVEKHDVGISCDLVRGETQVGFMVDSSIQQRLSSSQNHCNIVNVADYAARAAEAALAASRRSDRRPNKSLSTGAVNMPKESVDKDDDDDDENGDDNNYNRHASELMPPPPPLPPTLPSQPKVVATSRKPTIGARYLRQQQLLLDRHRQLERMRREEKEKQQRVRFENLQQQREFNGKEKEKRSKMMEVDDFSTDSIPSMQLIGRKRPDKFPTSLSQNMYPRFNGKDQEELSYPGHSRDKDTEISQHKNYYFYCGDYCSSDDETSGSSSIEPPFPPLMHDLRIDQLPRPSSRVPAAAVLPPGVRKRQTQIPQSIFTYRDDELSSHDCQPEVERQHSQSVLQPSMYKASKKRRNVNEPIQKEILEHDVLKTKLPWSSPPYSPSLSLGRDDTKLGMYSSKKLSNKMQSNLRKQLQFELLEKPGQRQQYQQFKNDNVPVDVDSQNETVELQQQHIIPLERLTNSKMIKSNNTSRLSRHKVLEKSSATVEEKTNQEYVEDVELELTVQQKINPKQIAASLISKKKNKRQSKRIGSRRKIRKRRDKTSVLKDEDSSSSEEEEKSEEVVDIEELRMVQWKAPLTQWNKRPISYLENINHERSIEENVNVIERQTKDVECYVVSDEDTEESKCDQNSKNKIPDQMWREESIIYLQDSEFSEMKRLDFEYRELMTALLSDYRIKHLIQIQQNIPKNMTENSSMDIEKLPTLLSLSSPGNEVQECLAIHQMHFWMSKIQQKREEIFNFMIHVQDNSKRTKEVTNNKLVFIRRLETVSEVDILQEWHDIFLSKYEDKPDDNTDCNMYNDKRLFLIQDLVDQYYPIGNDETANNKWLRVAKINLHNSEFSEMKQLTFEYRELMKSLMLNQRIRKFVQIQDQLNFVNISDDEDCVSHLILSSPLNEEQRKSSEDLRGLISKIKQKWEEMYLLLKRVNSRARVATDKQLVLTQRVETSTEIDPLRFWHDYLLSACKGKDDNSKIMDHFLILELIDRHYLDEYDCDKEQIKMLVTPEKQSQNDNEGVFVVKKDDDISDFEDDDDDEEEELELEKQILRIEKIKNLDRESAFLAHFKEQHYGTLKDNEGELKQLLELRQDQYQKHAAVNDLKGFHDFYILKIINVTPAARGIDSECHIRVQLFYKIMEKKNTQMHSNVNDQQQISYMSKTKSDRLVSFSTNKRESIFELVRNENKYRGSAHWWIHFGLERRTSPLIGVNMSVLPFIQSRPMVTMPFVNQLQLTKPETKTMIAQVFVNKQKSIEPLMPTFVQEMKLQTLLEETYTDMMTDAEISWLKTLQAKHELFRTEGEQHWKEASLMKQKQEELLLNKIKPLIKESLSRKPKLMINIICVEHETDLHKQWNLLETARRSHEKQWKKKRFEYFELKKISRLYFRESFSRLANHFTLNDYFSRRVMRIAFEHFSSNFPPLNQAEQEKLHQAMLNPYSIEGESFDEYHQKVLNIFKQHEPSETNLQPQISTGQQNKTFKPEQLLNLVIDQEVFNFQELRSMDPNRIKHLLQKQSAQFHQQEQNNISLRHQIYKYKQAQSDQEIKEKEQIRFSRELLRNIALLNYNQRILLLQQLSRVNEHLPKIHDEYQAQTLQALNSSTQAMSTTSVILVPQPSISKQLSSKSSVILTSHKPSTLKQYSTALLIPHNSSTSLQSSVISVRPQPLPEVPDLTKIKLKKLRPLPFEILEETRKTLNNRLGKVNRILTPLMKLWEHFLYFPERSLHEELDDIVENRLRDLGVDVKEGLQSIIQQLQQIGNFDGRIGMVRMTPITKQRFIRLQKILDHLQWRRNELHYLVGELTILTYHERPVISMCHSSWGTHKPNYSLMIELEKNNILAYDSMYSMFLTLQKPLSFLQRFALPLLRMPNELPTIDHPTHSLLLKLRRSLTKIQEPSRYTASMILLQSCMSNQISSTGSELLEAQKILKSNQPAPKTTQALQFKKLSLSSLTPITIPESFVDYSRMLKKLEKRRLSDEDENGNSGKKVKSTYKKKHPSASLSVNRKRRRQISTSHQIKKSTSTIVHDVKDNDVITISDSNDDNETSDSSSESSLEASIQNPTSSMTVQMSEKSPLTIKLIRVKQSPPVVEPSLKDFEKKSNNLSNNQNSTNKDKKKVGNKKHVDEKIKKDDKKSKKTKQKVSEKEGLKKTNQYNDQEDHNITMTIEKENPNIKLPVVDHVAPTSTGYTALINQPSQVSITVRRPIEVGAVIDDKPTKNQISSNKPIKVALIEYDGSMKTIVDGRQIKVISKNLKPVNMVCKIDETRTKECNDYTMGVIKGIVDAAEKTIKKLPKVFTQKPQKENGCSPIQKTTFTDKCKTNQSIEKCQINTNSINTKNINEELEMNVKHQLTIPIHNTIIERHRHSVRTITMDYKEPAVPIFYDHGFADGTPERVVQSRFVSCVMSMMAAHSVPLRPPLIPPQRLKLFMDCATKKQCSNEPLTIGGVNINKHSTLSSLLDQVISQDSTVKTTSIIDSHLHNSYRTSNLTFDAKQVKKQINTSKFQEPSASTSPSIKITPVVEEPVSTMFKKSISTSSSLNSFVTDVNTEYQKTPALMAFLSTPPTTMTASSFLSLPAVGLLEEPNSSVKTTSNVTSLMGVTETLSDSNIIKRSESALFIVSSSSTSNTTMVSSSPLINPTKISNSAAITTIAPETIIDTIESTSETDNASGNSLKRHRLGKRSTSVTTVSSLLAVAPPKRSKSAVAMTVLPCSTKTVTIQTAPIMASTKTTAAVTDNSKDTPVVSTSGSSSGVDKGELSTTEASHDSCTDDAEKTIIVKEDMETVTVKRNMCTPVPAPMDVTADACSLVVSVCEEYVRALVKERLEKGGQGAGTRELCRRNAFIAAMAADFDIRPTPEYCRTKDIGTFTFHPVMTHTGTNDNSRIVLEQQRLQNYSAGSGQSKKVDVLTIETIVETQTTTTTTTSISSTIDKQFPTVTSSIMKTISSPLVTDLDTSARTRGMMVSKMKKPSSPGTMANSSTTNKFSMVDNQQLKDTLILSPNNQPVTAPLTKKLSLAMPSTSKENIIGPSTIKLTDSMSLNNSQPITISSICKLPTAVSTSTVKQCRLTLPMGISTDTMKKPQITPSVIVTKTPPISTSKKQINLTVGKSNSASSIQRGRPVVRPAFHRRQPFGSLVATCSMAAAESTVINKNAHMFSSASRIESDESDDDIDDWSYYLGDRKNLPPLSRLANFPMCKNKTKVPVMSMKKNDTSSSSAHNKNQCILSKTPAKVDHLLQQEQQSTVSKQHNEEKNKASQQRLKLNLDQQFNPYKNLERSLAQRLYQYQNTKPETLNSYHEKFLSLQFGSVEKPLLDQPEIRHRGLVSWY